MGRIDNDAGSTGGTWKRLAPNGTSRPVSTTPEDFFPVTPAEPDRGDHWIELRAVKVARHLSEETTAFTASVYLDGKKVGDARNDGIGGPTLVSIYDRETARRLHAACASLPDTVYKAGSEPWLDADLVVPTTLESVVDDLVDATDGVSWMRRQTRRKTMFLLAEDDGSFWRTVSGPWSEKVRDWLYGKYGDKVARVGNLETVTPFCTITLPTEV